MIRSPEFRLRDQQCAESFGRDDQSLHRCLRISIDQRRPARQLRQFAHEAAGRMGHDRLVVARAAAAGDVDLAGQDDRQAVAGVADLYQCLARSIGADLAKPAYAARSPPAPAWETSDAVACR